MNWQDKKTVKLGNAGERIVHKYLENKGFVVYEPVTDKAHPCDRFVASPDKEKVFLVEIKTKPARVHYPDTGFDKRHYDEYMAMSKRYRMRVFMAFVDSDKGKIYGNWLGDLNIARVVKGRRYPLVQWGIIYFLLD
ncbi:hypothetical protein LCGC14_3112330, partial [marine sediment metagenome]